MKKRTILGVIALLIMLLAMPVSASAATVKLNKTKMTVYVGQKRSLKLKGTSKTVKWSSSKKSVAKVSSSGVVRGIKAGTATITAKVGSKKYKCKVTVKNNSSTMNCNFDNEYVWKGIKALKYTGPYTIKAHPVEMEYDSSGQLLVTFAVRNETEDKTFTLKSVYASIADNDKEVIAKGYFNKINLKIEPGEVEYVKLRYSASGTRQYVLLKDLDYYYGFSVNY